jgi:hypothetical protein
MAKKKTLVNQLLESDIWTFWKYDWSEKITIQWDGDLKKLKPYMVEIAQKLGRDFMFERSVNGAIGVGPAPDIIIK